MKKTAITIIILSLITPFYFSEAADSLCQKSGYTVLTLNGVFTDEGEAKENKVALEFKLGREHKGEKISTDYLHNKSHLGKVGDVTKAVIQGVLDWEMKKDYDLVEMLRDASEKVKTRKLLLVSHSQGNFYANGFYEAVADKEGGVPTESIGIFGVATPTIYMAGGGEYLTSDTDKVIAGVVGAMPIRKMLPPNTHIELGPDDDKTGHGFTETYLKYRAPEIIGGIQASLDQLQALEDETGPCIDPPKLSLVHKAKGVAYAVADPTATVVVNSTLAVGQFGVATLAAVHDLGNFVAKSMTDSASAIARQTVRAANSLASVIHATFTSDEPAPTNEATQNLAAATLSVSRPPEDADDSALAAEANDTDPIEIAVAETVPGTPLPEIIEEIPAPKIIQPVEPTVPKTVPFVAPRSAPAGFGGGTPPPQPTASVASVPAPDTTAPDAPVVSAPVNNARYATTTVTFNGTAEAASSISTDVSSTTVEVAGDGSWALSLTLSQGTTAVNFYATDSEGNTSASTSVTVEIDSDAPTLSLSLAECGQSISDDICLIATSTANLSWSSPNADIAYYVLNESGSVSTTSATSLSRVLSEGSHEYAVAAIDGFGNVSATSTRSVVYSATPVVINEIAWGGTATSASDEWIELYNRTAYNINLSDWILYTSDGAPYLSLTGSVAPYGYYLIERKNTGETTEATESPITDITADLWTSFSFGLSNSGEAVYLVYKPSGQATTTVDSISLCNNWCGNGSDQGYSMERHSPELIGTDSGSWITASTLIQTGRDANGNLIKGTPKARNYANHLVNKNLSIASGTVTLASSSSPYLVAGTMLQIASGAALSIQPGTVVKFSNSGGFDVRGTIAASGSSAEPIIFTSIYDDGYGGDMNLDATSTSAAAGDWYGTWLSEGSTGTFDYVTVRYGGGIAALYKNANLYVERASPTVTNSIFEYSKGHGLTLIQGTSTISNNTIRNNAFNTASYGIYSIEDSSVISNNQFSANHVGFYTTNFYSTLSNNSFVSNVNAAIRHFNTFLGTMSGNSGSSNGLNGISLYGDITRQSATTTLASNSLPYVLDDVDVTVIDDSALSIEPGVVMKMKGKRLDVRGMLDVNGQSGNEVTFTSYYDDAVAGDTGNDGASVGWVESHQGINMKSGSSSSIEHAIIKYMKKGVSYAESSIDLANVLFDSNRTAISAEEGETIIRAENLTFTNNTATSTIDLD